MKKALLVTLDYPPKVGGVANYYYNIVKNLPSEKIEVLTNKNKKLLFNFPVFGWLKSFFTIYKAARKKEIEVILVGQVLPLGTVVWLLNKFLKKPYIVFTHAMDVTYPQKYPRKKWLLKKILNSAFKVITVSRYTKFELLKIMKSKNQRKIEIISPAPNITPDNFSDLDIDLLEKKYKNNKILLSVGRLVERKGYDMVIKSLADVLEEVNNIKYIIVGEGEYKEKLSFLVKKLKLEDKVIFTGKLKNEVLAKFYKLSDAFIMTSRQLKNKDVEGFGLVFLEANSFDKPVIGGKSGGVEDAVVDGKNGFLVDPTDKNMIATAIIRLLKDEDLAKKMGETGKERVEKEFTWKIKASRLQEILSF